MIIDSDFLFKIRCKVGAVVKPAVLVAADTMAQADAEASLHWADQSGYAGEPIVVIAATEIDPYNL